MLTFSIILNLLFLCLIVFGFLKLNVILNDLLHTEEILESYDNYFINIKRIFESLYVELNKISKYPVTMNDPIVQSLIKLVSSNRDKFHELLEQINKEEDE